MAGEQGRLEVDAVLLLISLHDVPVLDAAEAEAAGNADDGVVFGRRLLRLTQQGRDLGLHRDVLIDNDIGASIVVGLKVEVDGAPAACLESVDHCFSKRAVAAQNQTLLSRLHI